MEYNKLIGSLSLATIMYGIIISDVLSISAKFILTGTVIGAFHFFKKVFEDMF